RTRAPRPCTTLFRSGAEVLLAARKQEELDQAVAHLSQLGVTAHAVAADLGKPEAVHAFADAALAKLGHCDILVNNAGATWGAPRSEEHTSELQSREK